MKKIFYVFIVILIAVLAFYPSAFAYEETLIEDAANLFDDYQETEITSSLLNFSSETSFSAAVISTDNAEGKTSQAYADDYYDNLVVSEGWSDNGILFLIDMDNREVCISTMGECISLYADSIDYIIDCGYSELVNGYYSDCILLMIEAAYDCSQNIDSGYYEDYYNNDYEYYNEEIYYNNAVTNSSRINFGNIASCFVIALIIAAVSVFIVKSKYKNMGKGDEFDADDVILNLTGSNDTVISRNVVTTRVPRNNNHNRSGSRGGSSGGGRSHRSSGGFSHGGGSRKF